MTVYVVMQGVDIDGYHRESNLFGIYSEESIAKKISEGLVDSYCFDEEVDSNIPELFGYYNRYFPVSDELNSIQNLDYVPKEDSYNAVYVAGGINILVSAKTIKEAEEKINSIVEKYKQTEEAKNLLSEFHPDMLAKLRKKK